MTSPGGVSINEGVNIYYKYFSKQDEELYKIIAIRLKVIK